MTNSKKYTAFSWLLFFISVGVFIFAIVVHFSYLTLILPFMLTSFVKAMDIM